jgi:hypothetical protein
MVVVVVDIGDWDIVFVENLNSLLLVVVVVVVVVGEQMRICPRV